MELEYSSVDEAFAPMRVPDLGTTRHAAGADVPFADIEADDSLPFSAFSASGQESHSAPSAHSWAAPSAPAAHYWAAPSATSAPSGQWASSAPSGSWASSPSAPPVWSSPPVQPLPRRDSVWTDVDGVAGAPAGAGRFVAKESLVSAPRYDQAGLYTDDSRVSCSDCRWVLEDRDWCCKYDCNDKSSPHYRQAYVCADPSDKSGRLTSRCEVETECRESQPPVMCDAARLGELQRFNTMNDPSCAVRPTSTAAPSRADHAPWSTRVPDAPWATRAPGR
jgi:hypothetical protein